jgi:hypothetical protein
MSVFSTPEQLTELIRLLSIYSRLPVAERNIPGAIMEAILAYVHKGAEVLHNYDFVDVLNRQERVGWQVKSTHEGTPLTWMRAKIPNRNTLIAAADNPEGIKILGGEILKYANDHIHRAFTDYQLDVIGYVRLIIRDNGTVTYFERKLCTSKKPILFNPENFRWNWSEQKQSRKKEQLPALVGTHIPTGEKWWAWHGRGENQLHFSAERTWWPAKGAKNCVTFPQPTAAQRLSFDDLERLIEAFDQQRSRWTKSSSAIR